MHKLSLPLAIAFALVCSQSHSAEDYTLQAFSLTANAPVKVSLSGIRTVGKPLYRAADGAWKPLATETSDAAVEFSLPQDAVGSSLILLDQPPWLTLPDTEAPTLRASKINGAAGAVVDGTIVCGHVTQPPEIELQVADEHNPLLASRVQVWLNGMPLESEDSETAVTPTEDGKQLTIRVKPGELPKDKYTVSVSVRDASPARNEFTATISFSTAPLLRNADFEAVGSGGRADHWSFGSWKGSDPGEFKAFVAEGEGRTGNALCLQGISGRVNIVAGQTVDLIPGRTYVLSGYTRGEVGGYASLIASSTTEAKAQYDNTTRTAASDEWVPFAWELTPKPEMKDYTIYLRSAAVGAVYFDDVELAAKE